MAVDQPFPSGTFKVGLGPGSHDVELSRNLGDDG